MKKVITDKIEKLINDCKAWQSQAGKSDEGRVASVAVTDLEKVKAWVATYSTMGGGDFSNEGQG